MFVVFAYDIQDDRLRSRVALHSGTVGVQINAPPLWKREGREREKA